MKATKAIAAGAVGLAAIGVGLAGYYMMNTLPSELPEPLPDPYIDPSIFPTSDEVSGDLDTNWGETPVNLRPLFMFMEEASQIVGSGRLFALIAWVESEWIHNAHNNEPTEVAASRKVYRNLRDKNPPLLYGDEAAAFGSGGLFGALAPNFLWSGVSTVGNRAPLLQASTSALLDPSHAAFAAIVHLEQLLQHETILDHYDIAVGWTDPNLLTTEGRESDEYRELREKYAMEEALIQLDLLDQAMIPERLDASSFPGVLEVWERMISPIFDRAEVTT